MVKEVKESNKRRVDEKVKSMIRIDGLKISTSHSTHTFCQAYYFPPLSPGARYVLSLFHHVIQQQLSIKQQSSSSVGDGRVDSIMKKSSNSAAAAAKDMLHLQARKQSERK